jgi:Ca2+-binding EF-hand superfamily protein
MPLLIGNFLILAFASGPVSAQFRGGPGSGDFQRQFLQRMDQNGNGVLEPGEISDRARGFIDRMARDAGLDPGQPIPISRLGGSAFQGPDGGRGQSDRREGRDERDRRNERERRDQQPGSSSSSGTDPYPLVPRFGDPLVLGFGVSPLSLNGHVIDLEKRYDRRVLEQVERAMQRYDRNRNGILEYDEWQRVSWRPDPRQSDLDGDGQLTKAEVAERYAKEQAREESERRERRERFDPRSAWMQGGEGFDRFRGGGPRGGGDESGEGRRGGERFGGFGGFGRGGFDPAEMLARMDRNGDGALEPEEVDERGQRMFERFGLDPSATVRLDEIRQRFERRGQDGSGGEAASDKEKSDKEKSDSKASDQARRISGAELFKGRKSFRPLASVLPKNLPSWWKDKDDNSDGQVSVSEFMTGRSDNTMREFFKYDVNGDGVITAHEAEIVETN